jgi:hypothetical protein
VGSLQSYTFTRGEGDRFTDRRKTQHAGAEKPKGRGRVYPLHEEYEQDTVRAQSYERYQHREGSTAVVCTNTPATTIYSLVRLVCSANRLIRNVDISLSCWGRVYKQKHMHVIRHYGFIRTHYTFPIQIGKRIPGEKIGLPSKPWFSALSFFLLVCLPDEEDDWLAGSRSQTPRNMLLAPLLPLFSKCLFLLPLLTTTAMASPTPAEEYPALRLLPPAKTRKVSGGNTYSYVYKKAKSSKPTFLLLHGFPNSMLDWSVQISDLIEAGYGVLAPDMLGYGGTSKPTAIEEYKYSKMSAQMAEILDKEGLTRVVGVGHDW